MPTLRLTPDLAQRADALLPRLDGAPELRALGKVRRSAVLRLAIEEGLAALERRFARGPEGAPPSAAGATRPPPYQDILALLRTIDERLQALEARGVEPPAAPQDRLRPEDIVTALRAIDRRDLPPAGLIPVSVLRHHLGDPPGFDQVLWELYLAQRVILHRPKKPRALPEEERQAAFYHPVTGTLHHLVSLPEAK